MKFRLNCAVTVSASTVVEADTLEKAIEIAEEREMVVGGITNGTDENFQWVVDEIDGSPTDIREE